MADAPDPHRRYEFRCPVHGFIEVDHWERSVIDHPAFQRLRRIRQLAWTEYVYPGAVHTRFEHSLGVMHVATRVYNAVTSRSRAFLESKLSYDETGIGRDRRLIRFAALLHDLGHAPFSHASEELMPPRPGTEKKFRHEDYSAEVVRRHLKDAIENHPFNENVHLTADEIASLIDGTTGARRAIFWRELIDGQMDADRMDYLLRDSTHLGVQYGRFDLDRIVSTIVAAEVSQPEDTAADAETSPMEPTLSESTTAQKDSQQKADGRHKEYRLAVTEGGWHAAVGLVLARYYMFTQVYFHKTRVAYDIHLREALASMLPGGHFPTPLGAELDEYVKWDDWLVLGELTADKGGPHGERLRTRSHYRLIWDTSESPRLPELGKLDAIKKALGDLLEAEALSEKSWYKTGQPDIPIVTNPPERTVKPLSTFSPIIEQLKRAPHRQTYLYALPTKVEKAREITQSVLRS
jgi:HD superfamily phosphohydrolase